MIEATHKPRRPGGLTALAILNIIFALVGAIGGLTMVAMSVARHEMVEGFEEANALVEAQDYAQADAQENAVDRAVLRGMTEQMHSWSPTGYRAVMALGYAGGLLMFLSAFGLLGQRRWLGKQFALVAGVALIGCAVVSVATLGFFFWGFPFFGATYAIVLIALTQTVYKPVLVH